MSMSARALRQRTLGTLHRFEREVDPWVATAGVVSGVPHRVPPSFLWGGERLLLATLAVSVTGRNLRVTGKVRRATARPTISC